MAGFQSELYKQRMFTAKRNDMITTAITELDKTTSATTELSGSRSDWATAGFFGRINYDYAAKYLLELNLRYDGTSRFRNEQRWGFFPSVSVGWNVANEAFWESLSKTVGQLKIRASYGELGNQNTNSWYPTYQTIPTSTAAGSWLVNGVKPNTADAPNLISSSLTWERVQSWNAGVDLGAFKNRLTASFDYYNRYTLNMVGPAPTLPAILGTAVPSINNTDLKTFGFELSLGWRDVVNGFSYGVQATLADSRTRILSYPNETYSIDAYRINVITDDIWGYKTVGLAKTDEEMTAHLATMPNGAQNAIGTNWKAGDIMYADLNGDGKISAGARTEADHGDLMVIGNKKPRFMYGLNLDFAWKGIDLSMFWQGVGKRDYMPDTNNMVFWGACGDQWWSTALKEHLDYFRNDETNPLGVNLDAYYPRPLTGGAYGDKNHKYQTRYVQDASYLRLKNLQIGYTLPANITKYIGSSSLRVFLSGENLLTFTKLSSTLDPESIGIGGNGSSSSVGTVYPLSTVYSCGLSINF
jgi:TonB-linked SusC/RagA family outer membrane protein